MKTLSNKQYRGEFSCTWMAVFTLDCFCDGVLACSNGPGGTTIFGPPAVAMMSGCAVAMLVGANVRARLVLAVMVLGCDLWDGLVWIA